MGLNANVFITMNDAKAALKQPSADDATLEQHINSLTAVFEGRTRRKIKTQALTDFRIDGNGAMATFLPFVPVQTVTKIELRQNYNESVYKTLTDPTKWILKDNLNGQLQLIEDIFIRGSRNCLITMTVGYVDADPDLAAIRRLFLMQLKYDFRKEDLYEVGAVSRTFQDGSVTFSPTSQLLKEVENGLEYYRDYRVVDTFDPTIRNYVRNYYYPY